MVSSPFHSFLLILCLLHCALGSIVPNPKNTYIVQTTVSQHNSVVSTLSNSEILHMYDTVIHGFAVQLTDEEARRMSSVPGVSAMHKDRVLYTQTTRSPGFLGLNPELGAWPASNFGDGIIIGFVDTGIWPEHASFNDSELGPVPPRWRGKCTDAEGFFCNRKLIGAQSFVADGEADGIASPRDKVGHGTHVASTAAGTKVRNASVSMFARGDASGVAPRARISMYKACNAEGRCRTSSIAAAIDTAVKDGVDVLSISLGDDREHRPFYDDVLAIATFGAVRRGVFVAVAGGNEGPRSSTVINVAPWVTTVGAATVDRVFPGKLVLGNGAVLAGESLYPVKVNHSRMTPLVFSSCRPSDVTPDRVKDRIVACMERAARPEQGMLVQHAGGAGMVAVDVHERLPDGVTAQAFALPGLSLGQIDGEKLRRYMESVPYPTASFILSCDTTIGENRAPIVAGFSSRGPNPVVAEILKPDVIAPGVNILGAWPGPELEYHIISGTSMACPHVAGVAALIRKKHGDWSTAMVHSAIITSAWNRDNTDEDILDNIPTAMNAMATPLVSGAGLIRPIKALDPGLVYDAGVEDYVKLLCTLEYSQEQLQVFAPELAGGCTASTGKIPGGVPNLNYPSFTVVFDSNNPVRTVTRTVTKVSVEAEVYKAIAVAPEWVKVTVTPRVIELKQQYEKLTYTVEFRCDRGRGNPPDQGFGYILWDNHGDGLPRRQVRSPVAFSWSAAASSGVGYGLFNVLAVLTVLLVILL